MSNKRKTGAELLQAVQKAVSNIGKTNGTKAPAVNTPEDIALVEYAIAKAILAEAKAREEQARSAVESALADALAKVEVGNPAMIVHNSTYAGLTAQRVKGATRANKDKAAMAVALKFKLNVADAKKFIDEDCCTQDKDQLRLTPALILGE